MQLDAYYFFVKFYYKFLAFFSFLAFWHENVKKTIFWQVFGVRSTQTLVKIYNTPLYRQPTINVSFFFQINLLPAYLQGIMLNKFHDRRQTPAETDKWTLSFGKDMEILFIERR